MLRLIWTGVLMLCVPVQSLAADIEYYYYTDSGGTHHKITFHRVSRSYESEAVDNSDMPEGFNTRPAPKTPGWCFQIGQDLFWCTEVGWSQWSDSDWNGIEDPNIMLTLDPDLEYGRFISTDDDEYHAHLETEITPVRWEHRFLTLGSNILKFSDDGLSPSIAFHPEPDSDGRDYLLSYEIIARVGAEVEKETITQDDISGIRQEYVDLNRRRWGDPSPPHIPTRDEFKTDFHSANYAHRDYGRITDTGYYEYIVMNTAMSAKAEVIRKVENDSTARFPRITSGYRPPIDCKDNSLHQFGYALDMNPDRAINNPTNRRHMERRVRRMLGKPNWDTILHGTGNNEHIHFEKQTIAQGGDPNK